MIAAIWNLSTSQGSQAAPLKSNGESAWSVRLLRQWPVWALAAIGYFAAAWLGYKWATIQGIGSAIWPATGISLALAFKYGARVWPGVFVGALAAGMVNAAAGFASVPATSLIAVGAALEAVVGVALFRHFCRQPDAWVDPLGSLRSTLAFIVLAGVIGPMISASLGTLSLLLFTGLPINLAVATFMTWWLANIAGALVVAPVLMTFNARSSLVRTPSRIPELILMLVVTIGISSMVFLGWKLDAGQHYPLSYLTFPVMIWAALRFGHCGSSLVMLLIAVLAVLGTTQGSGPFAQGGVLQWFWLLLTYLIVAASTLLVMTTIALERQQQRIALSVAKDELDARVAMRTRDLERANQNLLESQTRLSHQAHHDTLTGLANRLQLQERLDQAIAHARRDHTHLGLFFLDLDYFKNVNDSHGHAVGDLLLQQASLRLKAAVRGEDTVARLGGDEFVILASELDSETSAAVLAEKLLAACRTSFVIDGNEFFVGASLGVSLFPDDSINAEELLSHADAALYRAKDLGRGGFQFYTPALTEVALNRVQLETALRRALQNEEFELFYQPQICLSNGAVVGVEALLRWNHPEQGLLAPDAFLATAEECGLIVPLGGWVLNRACTQMADWLAAGIALQHMAVNVAGRQLAGPVVEQVDAALSASGLEASFLHLEISENTLMRELDSGDNAMDALRQRGVGLAIDDFGTGFFSLAALRRLPITTLKLDRTFVQGLPDDANDLAIASTVIGLARNLNLIIVAEGIETEAQKQALLKMGCDEGQGWLIAKALPAGEVVRMLRRDV
jgi:diguanylate cyclase (GGDEF)-like protein